MPKVNENNCFKSGDLALISALCSCGYTIQKIERQSSGKVIFSIEKDEKIDELIQKFFDHKLKVDSLGYFNTLKEIKTRIYNA